MIRICNSVEKTFADLNVGDIFVLPYEIRWLKTVLYPQNLVGDTLRLFSHISVYRKTSENGYQLCYVQKDLKRPPRKSIYRETGFLHKNTVIHPV